MELNKKIINKNYGSIGHLSSSKMMQQADKKISIGQEKILTEKTRDSKDLIIVTEKIDGSNVGILKRDGQLIAITRAGYPALESVYIQHKLFYCYVERNKNLFNWLPENWRIVGEWCIQVHGTLYDISEESPFVVFDIINDKNKRILYIDLIKTCNEYLIKTVPILHVGEAISLEKSLELLGEGHYGKPEKPEGVVYRVERNGCCDFLAKWVRPDKEDGKFMKEEIYNKGYYDSNL
jgi:hypothetical protein